MRWVKEKPKGAADGKATTTDLCVEIGKCYFFQLPVDTAGQVSHDGLGTGVYDLISSRALAPAVFANFNVAELE